MRTLLIGLFIFIGLFILGGVALSFMPVNIKQTETTHTLSIKDLSAPATTEAP